MRLLRTSRGAGVEVDIMSVWGDPCNTGNIPKSNPPTVQGIMKGSKLLVTAVFKKRLEGYL